MENGTSRAVRETINRNQTENGFCKIPAEGRPWEVNQVVTGSHRGVGGLPVNNVSDSQRAIELLAWFPPPS